MSTKAYGSITIVDIGDLGELSVTPESNQPTMVIYDPDTSTYSPNWSTSGNNLVLTPVVYYGGTKLLDSSTQSMPSGLSITWQKKVGSGTPGAHGGSVGATGKLTVSTNPFDPTSNTLITYIVTATYVEPNSGISLTAAGQITYGLIQNATKVKKVTITGASALLYNSSGTCLNSPITLTATVQNVTITKWQYKNSGGTWSDISNSASSTLSVSEATSAYFNSDIGIFRVITNDANVYDEHTIVKLRDGAPGDQVDSAVLSNEDQMVPCNQSGNPVSGAFDQCTTKLTIYEGNTDKTSEWTIAVDQTHGVTGTWTTTGTNAYTFTASAITADTGYVTFTCTKTGHNTLVKTFSLTKVKAGADGTSPTIYSLRLSTLVVNKAENNTLTPASIVMSAYSQTGNAAEASYSGIFKVYKNGSSTATYTSSSAEPSHSYSVATSDTQIVVELYESGGSTLLDKQTAVVVDDGATGPTGPGGLTFVLGNYADTIPCTNGGLVAAAQTVVIPFTAFKGTTRQACTASYSTLPSGMTLASNGNKAGTTSAAGSLTFNIAANATLGNASTKTGTITITLTSNSTTSTQTYTWTKNNQALDGVSPVLFQLYTPDGNVISNDGNNVTVKPLLNEGASDVTTSGSYTWYYWNGSSYAQITSGSGGYTISNNTLTVTPTAVNSYVSIKCTCSYNSKSYDAYMSIYDKTDPLQISVLSTLGDKIINSVGYGILYTRVYRNGAEIDAIATTNTATVTNPTGYSGTVSNPAYCWYLNTTAKTATLRKYNGSAWSDVTDYNTGTYTWTALDTAGTAQSLTNNSGKAIYLDASIVNSKTIFNVEVTI